MTLQREIMKIRCKPLTLHVSWDVFCRDATTMQVLLVLVACEDANGTSGGFLIVSALTHLTIAAEILR